MDIKKSGTITIQEIKKILIQHYYTTHGGSKINRQLFLCTPNELDDGKTYLFVLQGTPPKGYGIYVQENHVLWLFDASGKRFKEYYLIKGISDLK